MNPEQHKLIEETIGAAKLGEEKKEELRRELTSHFEVGESGTAAFGNSKSIARQLRAIHSSKSSFHNFYYIITIAPALALAMFYGFVLRAYFVLGRLPTPYNPDPYDLGFTLHSLLALFLLVFAVGSPIYWLTTTLILWVKTNQSKKFFIVPTIVYVISFAVFIFLIRNDPGRLLVWFGD